VLGINLPWLREIGGPRPPQRLPLVMSRLEVLRLRVTASAISAQTRQILATTAAVRRAMLAGMESASPKLQRAGRAFLLRLVAEHGPQAAAQVLRELADEIEGLPVLLGGDSGAPATNGLAAHCGARRAKDPSFSSRAARRRHCASITCRRVAGG